MPLVPFDPTKDPDDESTPDIGDVVDRILNGGGDPSPSPNGA